MSALTVLLHRADGLSSNAASVFAIGSLHLDGFPRGSMRSGSSACERPRGAAEPSAPGAPAPRALGVTWQVERNLLTIKVDDEFVSPSSPSRTA